MASAVNRGFAAQPQSSSGGVLQDAREKVQEIVSTVSDTAEEAWDSASRFFRNYSIPLFFAGIGLGFLLAKALDNWSTDMTSRMSQFSNRS
jgi:hypothetical protein